jgi:hypothetical protein
MRLKTNETFGEKTHETLEKAFAKHMQRSD